MKPIISNLENRVMEILWSSGEATSEQIREALAPANVLKDSTVRTVLRRLEKKDFVSHTVDGRTFLYNPKVPRGHAASRLLRQIIDRVCAGSVETLLVGMVNDRMLTPAELQRLAKKISAHKK